MSGCGHINYKHVQFLIEKGMKLKQFSNNAKIMLDSILVRKIQK